MPRCARERHHSLSSGGMRGGKEKKNFLAIPELSKNHLLFFFSPTQLRRRSSQTLTADCRLLLE